MSGDFPRVQIVNKDGAFDGEEHGSGHDFHGEIQWIYGEKNVQQTNNYLLDLGLQFWNYYIRGSNRDTTGQVD